jgi:2-polyprenyl-3-methyl-5-hydroxy-6-metoxy-1,4-benzoquinol methylase
MSNHHPDSYINNFFLELEALDGCPGCGNTAFGLAFGEDIAHCAPCGLYFRSPRPIQSEIARSYATNETFGSWHSQQEYRSRMWDKRLRILLRHIQSGSLLDVGTGDAHFLDIATPHFTITGTDFSDAAADWARKRGHEIIVGQLEALDFGQRQFDCITLWHVLEHVPSPMTLIQKAYSLLHPGGVVVVAVPNDENKFFRYRLWGKPNPPLGPLVFGSEIHLSHFQPVTLRTFLGRNRFDVVEFGVDDIYLKHTLRNRMVISVHRIMTAFTQWHFGVAMYAVARKQARYAP